MNDMISFLTAATSRHFFILFYGNGGNMKSWLCSHFQNTTNADSQFFILRVSKRILLIFK